MSRPARRPAGERGSANLLEELRDAVRRLGAVPQPIRDTLLIDGELGFAVGGDTSAVVLKTTDGGGHWFKTTEMTEGYFTAVYFLDSLKGWVMMSYGGVAYKTTDGGYTWLQKDSLGRVGSNLIVMNDLVFASSDTAWAVGGVTGQNVIARTTNGGSSWTFTEHASGGSSLRQVFPVNTRVVYAVGWSYQTPLLRTTDGGELWEVETSSPDALGGFESIWMFDEQSGFAVGEDGFYELSDPVSVTGSGDVPIRFQLSQNHPNPFNPSTTIGYQLPVQSHVTLSVFNLLGQEVATLVDEVQEAGYRSVEFNASGLPSGMYLYRLQAGSSVQTRKLLLLK